MRTRQQLAIRNNRIRPGYRAKLAYTGASRMNRSNQSIPNISTTPTVQTTAQGHINVMQALRGCAFDIVSCDGYGGRAIPTVEANFDSHVLAYNPDIVIIGCDCVGNYIHQSVATAPGKAEESLLLVQSMVNKCIARGIPVVINTMPPNVKCFATLAVDAVNGDANGADDAGGTISKEELKFNRLIVDYVRNNDSVLLHRWGKEECYVDRADGRYVQSYTASSTSTTRTHDGTHQHPRGAWEMGIELDTVLGDLFEESTLPFAECNIDPDTWVANPMGAGTGGSTTNAGTASGTREVATSRTLNLNTPSGTCSVNASKVARDGLGANGEWQRITAVDVDKSITYSFTPGSIPTSYTAGTDSIFAAIQVMLLATPTNFRGYMVTATYADGGTKTMRGFNTSVAGDFATVSEAGPYIPLNRLLTFPTAIRTPSGSITALSSLEVELTKGAGGNMSVDTYIGQGDIFIAPNGIPYVEITPTIP